MSVREIDPGSLTDVRVVDPVAVEVRRRQRQERGFIVVAGGVLLGLCGVVAVVADATGGPREDSIHRMERLQRDPTSPWYKPTKASPQATPKPHVEYRVIENHVVKFEEGQAPYIYSMPYDLEQH